MFLPLGVADDGGFVCVKLQARQSLYSEIAMHTAFLELFGVLH